MTEESQPIFKSRKRQRTYRERATDDRDGETQPGDVHEDEALAGPRSVVVARKATGMTFRPVSMESQSRIAPESDVQLEVSNPMRATAQSASRFVAPTGQVVSQDDEHISAYIDSRLRQAHVAESKPSHERDPEHFPADHEPSGADHPSGPSTSKPDLSATTDVNVPRAPPPVRPEKRPRKPRLGRDGKPYVPRRRNVRSEDNVARDRLVEQILAQHNPDTLLAASSRGASDDDRGRNADLDAQVAEAFERDFHAAAEMRAARAKEVLDRKAAEPTKGPKMGGTRNRPTPVTKK